MSDAAPPDDLLSDILTTLQLRTSAVATFSLTAPWGMAVERFGPAFFYAVLEGELLLEMEGEAPVTLRAGDIFLCPRGDGCDVRSDASAELADMYSMFDEGMEIWTPGAHLGAPILTRRGGGGRATQLLVVLLDFADPEPNPLGLNLPRLIILRREDNHISPWLTPVARSIVEEAQLGRLGYFAMTTRLAELLFINSIRTHLILRPDEASGWLRGLSDSRIARALSAIHRRPGGDWTVSALAKEAGMSRSAFADRFAGLVGQTPFDYLTHWRMKLAQDWIAAGRRSVKAAAHELGYASEKAFSQAFKRTYGAPPSSFRPAVRPSTRPPRGTGSG